MRSEPGADQRRRPLRAVDGYPSGTDAPQAATAKAMAKVAKARSIVLVEGVSDQIAIETLAARTGRDLGGEGVVVVPIGGAQAIPKYLDRLMGDGSAVRLSGLCDAAEAAHYRRALQRAGLLEHGGAGLLPPGEGQGQAKDTNERDPLESAGFFVCTEDLEDELIRAAGRAGIEAVLADQGDLRPFASLQKQPAWRDQPFEAQMRRFLGAGSGRKSRYAKAIVLALDLDAVPRPLVSLLAVT